MARALRFRPLIFAMIATLLSGGCATTATIRTPPGARAYDRRDIPDDQGEAVVSPLEVTIVGSNVSSLHVDDDGGNPYRLGQYHVSDIDHPGNVLFWLGTPFVAFGAGILAALYAQPSLDPSQPGDGFVAIGYLMGWSSLAMGVSMMISGAWSWGRSKRAARAFEAGRPPAWLLPVAAPDRSRFER